MIRLALLAAFFWLPSDTAFAARACVPAKDPAFTCGSSEFSACQIRVGDAVRHYCQHSPHQGGPLPVVLLFHGAAGTAASMVNLWRSHTEESLILVALQARPTRRFGACINFWRQIGDQVPDWDGLAREDDCDGGRMTDDLEFAPAVLDRLAEGHEISGVYATGFSNGADFVYQLAITDGVAQRFDGLAASGAGMVGEKLRAHAAAEGGAGYAPSTEPTPFLVQMGTNDRKNLPTEDFIAAADGNPNCPPARSARDAMSCYLRATPPEGVEPLYMPTRLSKTRDWLMRFNRLDPRRSESLYPNLGQGEGGDLTVTVREDYAPLPDGAPAAVLTTIGGGHEWPGWGGARAPCPSRNCDIDLTEEVIQFWRANAGMRLPSPL